MSRHLPSPFQSRLHTNYTPDDAERVRISKICSDKQPDIQKLNEQITILIAQRDELQDFIDAHEMLLSPIRKLSPEILQQIFVACLPCDRNAVMSLREAPYLLGHVCSGWRTIAFSTAELWTSIHIVIPNVTTSKDEELLSIQRLEVLKEWLSRSGSLPLDISMASSMHSRTGIEHYTNFANALVPYCSRWRHLDFYVLASDLIHSSFSSVTGTDVSQLSTITLRSNPYHSIPENEQPFSFLAGARSLSRVVFQYYLGQLPSQATSPIPPFYKSSLVRLEMVQGATFRDAGELLELLSSCPQLRTVRMKDIRSPGLPSSSSPIFLSNEGLECTLPHLESFELIETSQWTPRYIANIWMYLHAPKLHSMSFIYPQTAGEHDSDEEYEDMYKIFAQFVLRSVLSRLSIILLDNHWASVWNGLGGTGENGNLPGLKSQVYGLVSHYLPSCWGVSDLIVTYSGPDRGRRQPYGNRIGEYLLRGILLGHADSDSAMTDVPQDCILPRLASLELNKCFEDLHAADIIVNVLTSRSRMPTRDPASVTNLDELKLSLPHPLSFNPFSSVPDRDTSGDPLQEYKTKIIVTAPDQYQQPKLPRIRTSPYLGLPKGPEPQPRIRQVYRAPW
jgi:hypothetical protein